MCNFLTKFEVLKERFTNMFIKDNILEYFRLAYRLEIHF